MATVSRGPRLLPNVRARAAVAKRLATHRNALVTATVGELEKRHDWFRELSADHRSWISVMCQAGIDGFLDWFADPSSDLVGSEIFASAPRTLARSVTLHQTVELVRTTIDVVEARVGELVPRQDRGVVQQAVLSYGREVAFATAEVYARAAESRGAWDARLEALVVDAVVRGEADEAALSRASALGWRTSHSVVVVVGNAPEADPTIIVERARRKAQREQFDLLAANQGDRLVVVLGGDGLDAAESNVSGLPAAALSAVLQAFGPGPIVIGPVVDHLMDAKASARAALSGLRAVTAWPNAPRPVTARDLLAERAVIGDEEARAVLTAEVYDPLAASTGGLLETLARFLDHSSSVEGTARALFVHANTVRYRLRRINELTGLNPSDARDAWALRMALAVGRLARPGAESPSS